ncbi:hypothetical protein ACQPZG_29460 [Streptomyces sp. CA-294286]|uniref:hypothetical protein n=1 Tax=Streptomyces sp. CA-294286 TaxID=3240070 RepID=UPI003D8CFBF1
MSEHANAVTALRRAEKLESASWRGSNWYVRFLLLYGAAQLVMAPALVLGQGLVGTASAVGVNTVVIAALSVYMARQRTLRRGFGVLHGAVVGSWGAAFGLTAGLGTTVFRGSPSFAVVATLACALPFAVAAWFEIRRLA